MTVLKIFPQLKILQLARTKKEREIEKIKPTWGANFPPNTHTQKKERVERGGRKKLQHAISQFTIFFFFFFSKGLDLHSAKREGGKKTPQEMRNHAQK